MSDMYSKIESLEQIAVKVALLPDPKERHILGRKLDYRCQRFDEEYGIFGGIITAEIEEMRMRLTAVVHIIFDIILRDDIDDKDFIPVLPELDVRAEDLLRRGHA
jgi:hypothetical protein